MLSQKINMRNTLAQIYHSYNSDTDPSQLSQLSQSKVSFFTDFQRRKKMIRCKIENTNIIPKQSYHRAYTLYQIDVLTQQIYFTTQKRYSQFAIINKRIKKFKSLQLKFPKKTYFQSGNQINVISTRITQLNQYIQSILNLGDQFIDIKFMFFDFIGLWNKYLQKGIDINNTDYQYFLVNSQNIYIEILKLNQNTKSISSILQRIRKLIFDYKIKLSLQTARQLFFGLENQKKGLIIFSLTLENQYIAIQFLQLVIDLLDTEISKNSQLFLKTLQNSSIKRLKVQQNHLLENINYKKLYFELLKKYQIKPSDKDLRYLFSDCKQNYDQFLFWLNGKKTKNNEDYQQSNLISSSTFPIQLYDKVKCKKSFQTIKKIIQRSQYEQNQNKSLISQYNLKSQQLHNQNIESLIMNMSKINKDITLYEGSNFIGYKIKFDKQQKNHISDCDRRKWLLFQQEMRNKYSDVVTKTLNFKNNKQKIFKFNEINQNQNSVILEPIHTDYFDDCFFQFQEIFDKEYEIIVIQIIYFCHQYNHDIKQYMKQKLNDYWIGYIKQIKSKKQSKQKEKQLFFEEKKNISQKQAQNNNFQKDQK